MKLTMQIPDDPIIRCMERTGFPPWIDSTREPICPVCGAECETIYKDTYGEIVGCDECLTAHDACEEEECFAEGV